MHLIHLSLLQIGFTIVENNLSKDLEDDLPAMSRHTSLSTGTSEEQYHAAILGFNFDTIGKGQGGHLDDLNLYGPKFFLLYLGSNNIIVM